MDNPTCTKTILIFLTRTNKASWLCGIHPQPAAPSPRQEIKRMRALQTVEARVGKTNEEKGISATAGFRKNKNDRCACIICIPYHRECS